MADAGGRFSVFSAAEVPPIRCGSALVRGGLPRNLFSPPSPRRKFLFRQKNFLSDSASEAIGPIRTHSDSGGLNRSPPRNCSATYITVRCEHPSAADDGVRNDISGGHFFQRTTPPVRGGVRANSGGLRRTPPDVRRKSGGVRRKLLLAEGRRIRAEPGGVRADPRVSARIRGGRSSAERKAFNTAILTQVDVGGKLLTTLTYTAGKNPYIIPDINLETSQILIKKYDGEKVQLVEVEVYGYFVGKFAPIYAISRGYSCN